MFPLPNVLVHAMGTTPLHLTSVISLQNSSQAELWCQGSAAGHSSPEQNSSKEIPEGCQSFAFRGSIPYHASGNRSGGRQNRFWWEDSSCLHLGTQMLAVVLCSLSIDLAARWRTVERRAALGHSRLFPCTGVKPWLLQCCGVLWFLLVLCPKSPSLRKHVLEQRYINCGVWASLVAPRLLQSHTSVPPGETTGPPRHARDSATASKAARLGMPSLARSWCLAPNCCLCRATPPLSWFVWRRKVGRAPPASCSWGPRRRNGREQGRQREKGAVSLPGYKTVSPVWNCLAGDEKGTLTWRLKVETTNQARTTSSRERTAPGKRLL